MDNIEEMEQTASVEGIVPNVVESNTNAEPETAVETQTVKVSTNVVESAKVQSPESDEKSSHKRILQGKVTSNKADKTILVSVERRVIHPLYKKYFKRTKRFMAHDEKNDCNLGDTVRIRESRPLSARKRWVLDEIIERAK